MNSQAVLVLGNHANRDLVQTLWRIGFAHQVWGSMRYSLDKLLHQRFAAVIVDRKFTHADVLEFILNVRDINREIPIVVIGSGKDEQMDQKIKRQNCTTILIGANGKDVPADKLAHALKINENENVQ
jgi:FixJ family two-component response regulator